ncbi:N-acetyltransferase DgcN [Phenylobacterium sp.]|uniref:N-acetyltransferase DgcN n=1 Tax=Phenylobacterium sp. TaxID=1871053 RepID=UPI00289BB71F|nr:N-acetyltransferase DgcN [Phenylobacterium sp.]
MSSQINILPPYLVFLGDVRDEVTAKTGLGLVQWRGPDCLGQARLPGCEIDLGLPEMSPPQAASAGARTLVIGIAPRGGALPVSYIDVLVQAMEAGLDVASGLHDRLGAIPALQAAADRTGRRLIDVRHSSRDYTVGNGRKRPGRRLLTVGTDCAVGKKYTALALHADLRQRGVAATFRATGQTGILIGGGGIAVDAVVADFVAGAAEQLAPAADADHWDVIEGQGSLFHPAFAGVSLGLLHGSQPDAFVVCHEPTRTVMAGVETPVPSLEAVIDLTTRLGRVTNADIRCVGVSINTGKLTASAAEALLRETDRRLGLPCVDPVRFGVAPITETLS